MLLHRATRRARWAGMAIVAVAVATTVVAGAASGAWAGTAPAKTPGGTIHLYLSTTSTSSSPVSKALVTGAFSDHGTSHNTTIHLSKGNIDVNPSKLVAELNSPTFGNFNAKSCSYWGTASGSVPIVGGTGAYTGITGTFTATIVIAGQGSLLKNGTCNEANNAPVVAAFQVVTATAKVSF